MIDHLEADIHEMDVIALWTEQTNKVKILVGVMISKLKPITQEIITNVKEKTVTL